MIIGLGADFWDCLSWMSVFFFGFCFLCGLLAGVASSCVEGLCPSWGLDF